MHACMHACLYVCMFLTAGAPQEDQPDVRGSSGWALLGTLSSKPLEPRKPLGSLQRAPLKSIWGQIRAACSGYIGSILGMRL